MSKSPEHPCVLVTGASSGIGCATAEYYVKKGWKVYGLSRSGSVSDGVISLKGDITKPEELTLSVGQLWKDSARLDAVIHSAGIGGTGPIENFPIAEAKKVMDTNFFGSMNVAQACLPYLRIQGKSYLIFISSIAGVMGVPFHGVYSASKFAIEGMVESLRQELFGSAVKVMSVCPGDTDTPILSRQFVVEEKDVSSFYAYNYEKADTAMRESVQKGIAPEAVAATVFSLMSKHSPKPRYFVGDWLQQISPLVKRFIPAKMFEKMMTKYYGLK